MRKKRVPKVCRLASSCPILYLRYFFKRERLFFLFVFSTTGRPIQLETPLKITSFKSSGKKNKVPKVCKRKTESPVCRECPPAPSYPAGPKTSHFSVFLCVFFLNFMPFFFFYFWNL